MHPGCRRCRLAGLVLLTVAVAASGCREAARSVYYDAWEKLGVDKRELMVDRVEKARDEQKEAVEQFDSALEHFIAVVGDTGAEELEERYGTMKDELSRSEGQANEVRERVDAVEHVAEALFDEWQRELSDYANASLRAASERQLRATRARYGKVMTAMRRAETRMEPVLATFRDQVLYLKHNLNAQAIGSLERKHAQLERDVQALVEQMQRSIREADAFVAELERASDRAET